MGSYDLADDINFFVQTEDGVQGRLVTGVQTCALPIYVDHERRADEKMPVAVVVFVEVELDLVPRSGRSEKRRAGKECRSRWSPNH